MQTFSFIGSDKNAGKTTAFNFVYRRLCREEDARAARAGEAGGGGQPRLCVTSIGINGEGIDSYDGGKKPEIRLRPGTLFVTADRHLNNLAGRYRTLMVYQGLSRTYVAGECLTDLPLTLEGPNSGRELLAVKARLGALPGVARLLIDGSIDRQFLAQPEISDGFYFALLLSDREPQLQKARDLLLPLTLPVCSEKEAAIIARHRDDRTRSLLFSDPAGEGRLLYHGSGIAALDPGLKEACRRPRDPALCLYLNGALSRALADFLAPYRNLTVILDNFTQYQNVTAGVAAGRERAGFLPRLSLLHGARAEKIFLRQEGQGQRALLREFADLVQKIPYPVRVHNLFRENPHEIVV